VRAFVHPDYDSASQANDIALVLLAEEAGPLTIDISRDGQGRDPARATVLGFGSFYEGRLAAHALSRTGAPTAQLSDRLRQAQVHLIDPASCAAGLRVGGEASGAYQLCAGADPAVSCIGDSGAPLLIEGARGDRLAGVVSFGSGCAVRDPITVYTRVAAYAGWIGETIARAGR
jgi:trypsin